MKPLLITFIVVILSQQCLSAVAQGLTTGDNQVRITDTVYTCSSYLSTLVTGFCDNLFKIVKRDTSSILIDRLTPRSLQELRQKERMLAHEHWRRVRRQIAAECCDQPCSVGSIIQYCPEESKLVKERPDIFE